VTQEVLRLLTRSGLAEVVERVRLYKVCVCGGGGHWGFRVEGELMLLGFY